MKVLRGPPSDSFRSECATPNKGRSVVRYSFRLRCIVMSGLLYPSTTFCASIAVLWCGKGRRVGNIRQFAEQNTRRIRKGHRTDKTAIKRTKAAFETKNEDSHRNTSPQFGISFYLGLNGRFPEVLHFLTCKFLYKTREGSWHGKVEEGVQSERETRNSEICSRKPGRSRLSVRSNFH